MRTSHRIAGPALAALAVILCLVPDPALAVLTTAIAALLVYSATGLATIAAQALREH